MNGKSLFLALIIAFLAAALTSFAMHEESRISLKYYLSSSDADRHDLEETIRLFNKLFATFYDTGGDILNLNEFPAANLVKRRVFQDIENWKKGNNWFIHDLHNTEFLREGTLSPQRAFVETRELWHMWVRDVESGNKSGYKVNPIKVRYYLGMQRGQWTVLEYEVYGIDDDFPELVTEWR